MASPYSFRLFCGMIAFLRPLRPRFPMQAEAKLLTPRILSDDRGFFFESWNLERFNQEVDGNYTFIQDNHSRSKQGVLRGIHYQIGANQQGKLVRVVRGSIIDVAVDLRRSSPTFKRWIAVELNDINHQQLWIPPGFGHGFYVLSHEADVLYKTTAPYDPQGERSIIWNDPELGIDWQLLPNAGAPLLSGKDANAPQFANAEIFE